MSEIGKKPLAVGDGKGAGVGEYQLLGAMIKCWALHGVYPIGECTTYLTIKHLIVRIVQYLDTASTFPLCERATPVSMCVYLWYAP